MADTIANYTGNGTQTDFVVPFDYLKKSFVRVYLDEVTLLTGGDYGDTTVDYYFLDNTTVRLKTAPASGQLVTIRRYTSATERIVSFEDASILKATDLDTSQLQSFHIAEEARDIINDALVKDSDGSWDAQGNRITNVGDPVDGSDAINLDWYNKDAGKVQQNRDESLQFRNEAEGFRNEAEGFKDTTKGYKDDAEESKNLAKDWAIKMDGKVVEEGEETDYSAKYWAQSVAEVGKVAKVVADNIEDVNTVADNIDDVNTVAGDLEGTFKPPQFTDMGRVGTGSTGEVTVTGGNIKIVADNIEDVQKVGDLIDSGQIDTVINAVETTAENVTKAKQSEVNAKVSEGLAKDWAVKTDGLVNNEDYSAKYYAQQAKTSADNTAGSASDIEETITQAKQDISTAVTQGVSRVSSTGSAAVSNINDAYDQATENLETAKQEHLSEITSAGTSQVQAVNTAGTTQVGLVTAEGTNQVSRVEDAGEAQVEAIDTSGTTHLNKINTAGQTQTQTVNTAGTTQTKAVNDAGATQVGLVEAASEEALSSISSKGAEQVASVNSAGQAQLATINASVQKAKDWAEKTDAPVEGDSYSAKYWAQQASTVAGQSDWTETNDSSPAFIKNKPDLGVYALKTEISTIYRYKGTVATYDQLPVASQVVGDAYNVASDDKSHGIKAGDNVVWNGTYWDNLSGYVDLSPYLTSEAASGIYLRQDTASTTYATKASLSSYATKTALSSGLSAKVDTSTYTADKATFLTKTEASNTYLGKTAKAASASTADSATKATQDASGNVITTTYATKSEVTSGLAGKQPTGDYATNEALTEGLATKLGATAKAVSAGTADSATKASQDANGNVIHTTYATKSELSSYATKAQLSSYALKTEIPDVSDYQTIAQHNADIQELSTEIDGKMNKITDYGRVGT